ncbi:MAG TPA: dihydropteroate synthase, partial [Holophagaceae bacterium]|nr:dihydropteroate synthase [Holophagaceae bacterium]
SGGPLFIGILNLTPDSFSDGGRFMDPESALTQARALVAGGCGMLDLGAESTRPGAAPISAEEEWRRLEAPLRRIREALPRVPLSLDTRHAEVAARGLAEGVAVLNDVTGFREPAMLHLAAGSGCGLIAMRSRVEGEGFRMPPYDGAGETTAQRALRELAEVRDRLQGAGIAPERILLDPGFGFGTTYTEDLALWEALPHVDRSLEWPLERICLGISRKRFTAWWAGDPTLPPPLRDLATASLHREARDFGLKIFRTHHSS